MSPTRITLRGTPGCSPFLVWQRIELVLDPAQAALDCSKIVLPDITVIDMALEVGKLLLDAQHRVVLVLEPSAA